MKSKGKILLSFVSITLLAGSLNANDDILEKLKALESRMDSFEKSSTTNEETMGEFEELLEKIETKSLSDKIKFSPELRVRMDKFKYSMADIVTDLQQNGGTEADRDTGGFSKNWKPHYSMRLRLNMATDITDNAKFTGRITVAKSSQNNERICVLSRGISAASTNTSTSFDVDKAYFDYSFLKKSKIPLIVSAGILPTTGGLSSNLIEGTPRKSVFPSLIFDMPSYGGILTANLSNVISENSWVRFVGGKAYALDANQYYYQCNRETIQNADIAGAFFETKIPVLGDNTFYIGANMLSNIKATPYLGSSGAGVNIKYEKEMGDITNFGAGLELRNISDTGLDFFIHGALSNPKPNGHSMDFTGLNGTDKDGDGDYDTVKNDNGDKAFTNASYARGTMIDGDGNSFYTGMRYTISQLKNAQIGAEYNKGSKYWWSGTQGSEDVFNKLATRGSAIELYYTQPWSQNISSRVGYLRIQEDYTGSGWHFGEPAKKDGTQTNMYFMVNAYF